MTSSPVAGVYVEPAVLRAATSVQLMTQIPDRRHRRGRRHRLSVVLVLAVAAVSAGARSSTAIGEWARGVGADLLDRVHLSGTVPSEATIRRVIEALDAGVFSRLCDGTRPSATQYPRRHAIHATCRGVRLRASRSCDEAHVTYS